MSPFRIVPRRASATLASAFVVTLGSTAPGPGSRFGRHTDKETGVGPWFKPFTLDYEFAFTGLGKKGGY